jgi:chemosensory pili system protein ChpA (sensor histidine kinase/response regulator)
VTRPRRQRRRARADRLEAEDDAERYKVVGPLRIQIALFNIYLNEADEQSRRLSPSCPNGSWNWTVRWARRRGPGAFAGGQFRHRGLPGSVGLARRLEHALERSQARGRGEAAEAALYLGVAEEIRRLLHQFAAGFLKPVQPDTLNA